MGRFIDMAGKRFGRLSIIEPADKNNSGDYRWLCKCDCGNVVKISGNTIRSGRAKSCGCLQKEIVSNYKKKNIIGQRFGKLSVVEFANKNRFGGYIWKCLCDCGRIKDISSASLINNRTKSCGCLIDENRPKGSSHYLWRGGSSRKKEYSDEWTHELREFIRNRDFRNCQYPECDYSDIDKTRKLSVHHIDGNKKNCRPENLISLCQKHHIKVEYQLNNWQPFFYGITQSYDFIS